ncbi:MAG: hypothetical protein JWQ71_374 [Pedosphaera sp.]|nr:hypothetical protein [Pedosphaera sp.]
MSAEFQVSGRSVAALFTLKLHRGDGMTLEPIPVGIFLMAEILA